MGILTKIKIFLARAKSGSLRRMLTYTKLAAKEAGRNPVVVLFDVVWCIFRYGVGYQDYRVFGFAKLRAWQRKTFFTYGHNVALTREMNRVDGPGCLNDKCLFLEKFSDCLNRQWMDLRSGTPETLEAFCKGKSRIFVKMVDGFGGAGAAMLLLSENTDYQVLYDKLMENRQFLLDEPIIQHPQMNRLCERSLNTVRIVTITTERGVEVAYTIVRIGRGNSVVDNVSAGGMYTLVDENGRLHFPAFCDKDACYYDCHPVTGTRFEGFQIPYFAEAVALVRKAALRIPEYGYVGWDVGITETGPVLVEANDLPGYDMPQNKRFCPDGVGLLPRMEALAGKTILR